MPKSQKRKKGTNVTQKEKKAEQVSRKEERKMNDIDKQKETYVSKVYEKHYISSAIQTL